MWLPTNDDTKTIQYDTKFLKSSPGRYPALKWTITKIEDTATEGISKFTMAQTQFDPAKDNCDLMIADYYESAVEPICSKEEESQSTTDFEIVYSGSPVVRAGGSYKKFTLKQRVNGELIDASGYIGWSINFGVNDDKLIYLVQDNIFKVKCTNDYSLIGKTFIIAANTENSSTSVVVEVASL